LTRPTSSMGERTRPGIRIAQFPLLVRMYVVIFARLLLPPAASARCPRLCPLRARPDFVSGFAPPLSLLEPTFCPGSPFAAYVAIDNEPFRSSPNELSPPKKGKNPSRPNSRVRLHRNIGFVARTAAERTSITWAPPAVPALSHIFSLT
jgi:hypothetical protein